MTETLARWWRRVDSNHLPADYESVLPSGGFCALLGEQERGGAPKRAVDAR